MPHHLLRALRPLSRRVIAGVFGLAFLAACSSSSDDPTGPSSAPATIRADGGNAQTGTVGTALATPLAVIVTDADGKPVNNATVSWDVGVGSGSTSSTTTSTNAQGRTQVTWVLGPNAGVVKVTAQVGGVTPVAFTATAVPGAPATVVALPDILNLGVGDTITLHTSVRDQFGNELSGNAVTYSTPDAALATVNANGFITAISLGAARIIATSGAKADTVPLTVSAAGTSACGSLAPTVMAVGQVITPAAVGNSARLCLAGGTANAEYGLVAFSAATVFGNSTGFEVYGLGLTTPIASLASSVLNAPPSFDLNVAPIALPDPVSMLNRRAELERRTLAEQELSPLVEVARESMAARNGQSKLGNLVSAKAAPNVGDVIPLNGQALSGCTNATPLGGIVKAVGAKSIVVADSTSPAGGYTTADYQSIAATFDTLVYPLDVDYFGAPTDISGYGKVILFFSTSVNRLTPQGAPFVIGGFFFSRDLYPKVAKNGLPSCAGSNEAEMFYLLVPDPNGTINGNRRTTSDVTHLNLTTLAHEFQHLINASRRLYVTPGAAASEETWLDEGLAHVAEELLYFKISGYGSRDNLNLQQVAGTTAQSTNFTSYQAQNFGRFYERLRNPEITSPYATNDSLSTRGATWNFLRYAAGRQPAGTEQAFFKSIVNSTTTGLTNLGAVLPGGQLASYLSDWSVATYVDDFSNVPDNQLDVRYKFPSWNFRSIFPNLRISGGAPLGIYPLFVRTIANNASQRVNLAGGGSGYARFAVPAGKTGVISLSSNGAAPANALRFSVIRVR